MVTCVYNIYYKFLCHLDGFLLLFLQLSRALASSTRITEVLKTDVDLTDENADQKDKKVENGRVELKMFISSITKT